MFTNLILHKLKKKRENEGKEAGNGRERGVERERERAEATGCPENLFSSASD